LRRSRRAPRRTAARADDPRALRRLAKRLAAVTPPPAYRSFGEALARVVDVLPPKMREWTATIPTRWAPYVFRGLLDGLLDDPRVTAHHRRRVIRARQDAEDAIASYKVAATVAPRRRGLPPPAPLNPEARAQVLAEYQRRAAGVPKGTRPEIWKALAQERGYSNWKQLRQQVSALRRGP
jgi:hypothetical protein